MKGKHWMAAGLIFSIAGLSWLGVRAEGVSGDEFRNLVIESDAQSGASWYLYRESKDTYCFKYSRLMVPKRYCVPKQDIEVKNGPDGRSKIGYVYKNQFVLKTGRFPGALSEVF